MSRGLTVCCITGTTGITIPPSHLPWCLLPACGSLTLAWPPGPKPHTKTSFVPTAFGMNRNPHPSHGNILQVVAGQALAAGSRTPGGVDPSSLRQVSVWSKGLSAHVENGSESCVYIADKSRTQDFHSPWETTQTSGLRFPAAEPWGGSPTAGPLGRCPHHPLWHCSPAALPGACPSTLVDRETRWGHQLLLTPAQSSCAGG